MKLFKKREYKNEKKDEIFRNLSSWKELPGFSEPSVEDLKIEAIKFERSIKQYLNYKGKEVNKRSNLNNLVKLLPNYPYHPDYAENWNQRVEEFDILRDYRNRLIHHRDCDTLPPVKELYYKFKEANRILTPMGIVNGSGGRFRSRKWNKKGELELFIDDLQFNLEVTDIRNLLFQLNPHSRGKVNFEEGLMVVAKYHDYFYDVLTVYIEGYPSFELADNEIMILDDYLDSLLGQRLYA